MVWSSSNEYQDTGPRTHGTIKKSSPHRNVRTFSKTLQKDMELMSQTSEQAYSRQVSICIILKKRFLEDRYAHLIAFTEVHSEHYYTRRSDSLLEDVRCS